MEKEKRNHSFILQAAVCLIFILVGVCGFLYVQLMNTKVASFSDASVPVPVAADVDKIPTEMTVGGRTYEILGFLQGDEESVTGKVMVDRAKEMNVNLNQEDCQHILKYQDEIPAALRDNVYFVFPDLRHPGSSEDVAYVCWYYGSWIQHWRWLGYDWRGDVRVLRRK